MRGGEDVKLVRDPELPPVHTFETVYREMLIQVCLDYPSLGDFRQLTDNEILFFYNGIRPRLLALTKQK